MIHRMEPGSLWCCTWNTCVFSTLRVTSVNTLLVTVIADYDALIKREGKRAERRRQIYGFKQYWRQPVEDSRPTLEKAMLGLVYADEYGRTTWRRLH